VRVTDADGNKLGGVFTWRFDDEASELNDALDYPGKVVRLYREPTASRAGARLT